MPFNRRIRSEYDSNGPGTANGISRAFYIWDGKNIVLDFTDSDGPGSAVPQLSSRNLWGEKTDQLFSVSSSGICWALTDNLGSVRDMVDSIRNSKYRAHGDYYSFGKINNTYIVTMDGENAYPGNYLPRFQFTCQQRDSYAGLDYYKGRWYDTLTGRFWQQDPIEFTAGDGNLYRYVGNGPTNATDPSGLWHSDEHEMLTKEAFVIAQSKDLDKYCSKKILNALKSYNVLQDEGTNFWDNARHYCRDKTQSVKDGNDAYKKYLKEEEERFNNAIQSVGSTNNTFGSPCVNALQSLGLLMHSWQDYFAHGVRASDGKPEPIWSWHDPRDMNFSPTPDNLDPYVISPIYGSSQHPKNGLEPAYSSKAETDARYKAAIEFVSKKIKPLLDKFHKACGKGCYCR
jgi:RHS repeat-associated protein